MEAIEETVAIGIPVNVTLLFSLKRHRQAAEPTFAGCAGCAMAAATRRGADHGEVSDTLEQGLDDARRTFDQVAATGVAFRRRLRLASKGDCTAPWSRLPGRGHDSPSDAGLGFRATRPELPLRRRDGRPARAVGVSSVAAPRRPRRRSRRTVPDSR
jgi:hypothetical protein